MLFHGFKIIFTCINKIRFFKYYRIHLRHPSLQALSYSFFQMTCFTVRFLINFIQLILKISVC